MLCQKKWEVTPQEVAGKLLHKRLFYGRLCSIVFVIPHNVIQLKIGP
jgi:hypothetical protein